MRPSFVTSLQHKSCYHKNLRDACKSALNRKDYLGNAKIISSSDYPNHDLCPPSRKAMFKAFLNVGRTPSTIQHSQSALKEFRIARNQAWEQKNHRALLGSLEHQTLKLTDPKPNHKIRYMKMLNAPETR